MRLTNLSPWILENFPAIDVILLKFGRSVPLFCHSSWKSKHVCKSSGSLHSCSWLQISCSGCSASYPNLLGSLRDRGWLIDVSIIFVPLVHGFPLLLGVHFHFEARRLGSDVVFPIVNTDPEMSLRITVIFLSCVRTTFLSDMTDIPLTLFFGSYVCKEFFRVTF